MQIHDAFGMFVDRRHSRLEELGRVASGSMIVLVLGLAACGAPDISAEPPASPESWSALRFVSNGSELEAFRAQFPELCATGPGGLIGCFAEAVMTSQAGPRADAPVLRIPDPENPYPEALSRGSPLRNFNSRIVLEDGSFCVGRGYAAPDWEDHDFQVVAAAVILTLGSGASGDRAELGTIGSGSRTAWKAAMVDFCAEARRSASLSIR